MGQAQGRRPPAVPAKGRTQAAPSRRPAGQGKSKGKGKAGSKAPARPRGRRQPAWLAIGAAAVIVAAVAVILVITSPGSGPGKSPKASASPRHAVASPTPPPGLWGYIGTRSTDQQPLSMHELYPASFSNAGTVYTEVKEDKTHDCGTALIGSALQTAVRTGHCTQAVRATYVSRTAGVMATIGVFNLKDSAAASRAASKAGHSEFVAQLVPKAGPARKIGQGTGIEEALLKGHYDVLVWAEFTDLHAPKSQADRALLDSFMKTLIDKTANLSLSYRMVDGKPVVRA